MNYTAVDLANVYKLDIRVVLSAIEKLGFVQPLSLEQAEAVRVCATPETVLKRLPEWVVAAMDAIYERAWAEGFEAGTKSMSVGGGKNPLLSDCK